MTATNSFAIKTVFELLSSGTSSTRLPQEKFLPNSRLFKEALHLPTFRKGHHQAPATQTVRTSQLHSSHRPGWVSSKQDIPSIKKAVCCSNVDCSREGQGKGLKSRRANLCVPRLQSTWRKPTFHSQPCKWRTNKLNPRWLT